MPSRWTLLLLLLCLLETLGNQVAELTDIDGRLIGADDALHAVRLVLNGGSADAYSAIPRIDGSFVFHSVAAGSYLLEVQDTLNVWPTVRLDVQGSGKRRASLSHNRQPLPFTLPLEMLQAKPTFFEKREGFKVSGMLMNPMVIMMGVTMLLMVVFPKMMANMDPEQLKEVQQMQDMLNPEKLKEKAEGKRKSKKDD